MSETSHRSEKTFLGTAVSPGISIGPLQIVSAGTIAPIVYPITEREINREQQRFGKAIHHTKKQLSELRDKVRDLTDGDEAGIFEAHVMVLEDSSLINKVLSAIKDRLQNAEYAFYAVMQNFLEAMRRVPDPYLRERTSDLEDVTQRVLRNFSSSLGKDVGIKKGQHLILAHDLAPSDTASMDRANVLGFATELGSINSHTAILARSLGIPAIVGLENAVIELRTLSPCILDGYTGKFIIDPTAETIEYYRSLKSSKEASRDALNSNRDLQAVTTDGHQITLSANIEFNHELEFAISAGAEGIGLYRTEFFLLNDDSGMPDELHQADIYTEAVQANAPNQVIFRTLDAGGDKLPVEALAEPEPNPFLGWRGIRVSLAREEMFKTQLRALLRASAAGPIGIMFPLISTVSELVRARKLYETCRAELIEQAIPVGDKIEIGAMIEVPSAAIIAPHLAKLVDFFSIGTNDLIQYTLAVDRVNHHVADLYKPSHPAVIQLMKSTVQAAQDANIWTGICGEMAQDLVMLPLMIGLGVHELSTGSHQLPAVRSAIRQLNYADCQQLAERALQEGSSRPIYELSKALAMKAYPDLLDN